MREILYRGLNANGEFVYGLPYLDAPNSTAYYNDYSYRITWIPEKGGHANQPVKNGTMGQFTGILDKNGVNIFEGDILKLNDCFVAKVEFIKGAFALITKSIYATRKFDFNLLDAFEDIEIIGDIHRNPELLEGNN